MRDGRETPPDRRRRNPSAQHLRHRHAPVVVSGRHEDLDSGGFERTQDLLRDFVVALLAETERHVAETEDVRRQRSHRKNLGNEMTHRVVDVVVAAVRPELLLAPRLADVQVAHHDREVLIDSPRRTASGARLRLVAPGQRHAHSCGGEISDEFPPCEICFANHVT